MVVALPLEIGTEASHDTHTQESLLLTFVPGGKDRCQVQQGQCVSQSET